MGRELANEWRVADESPLTAQGMTGLSEQSGGILAMNGIRVVTCAYNGKTHHIPPRYAFSTSKHDIGV